jgi:hypothetical protein
MCGSKILLENQIPTGQVCLPHFTHGLMVRYDREPNILSTGSSSFSYNSCIALEISILLKKITFGKYW